MRGGVKEKGGGQSSLRPSNWTLRQPFHLCEGVGPVQTTPPDTDSYNAGNACGR